MRYLTASRQCRLIEDVGAGGGGGFFIVFMAFPAAVASKHSTYREEVRNSVGRMVINCGLKDTSNA